jgi:sugar phosphate isomerase/epimerase
MSVRWARMVNNLSGILQAGSDGFDRIQPSVEMLITLSKEDWAQMGIVPEVCSSPLPPDAYVTQRGFNIYVWTEYLKKAVSRAAELGCKKIAWSEGRSRVLPLEGDISAVKEQVMQFLYMLCEISGNFGISVLIEPLGPRRTNFLNSLAEISEFLPLVDKDNLSSMISLRELQEIGLSPSDIGRYSLLISHVQLENPLSEGLQRTTPLKKDGYDYTPFLAALKTTGYDEVITLPENATVESLEYCRSLWKSLN